MEGFQAHGGSIRPAVATPEAAYLTRGGPPASNDGLRELVAFRP